MTKIRENRQRVIAWGLIVFLTILAVVVFLAVATSKAATVSGVGNELTVLQLNWQLEELWTLGGLEIEDAALGRIGGITYQDSLVYILDTKCSLVYVMDLYGKCLELVNVQGEGPGQCTNPGNIIAIGGGMLGLVKGQPATIIVTDFFKTYPENHELRLPELELDRYGFVIVGGIHKMNTGFLASTVTTILMDRDKAEIKSIRALSIFTNDGSERKRILGEEVAIVKGSVQREADIPHFFPDNRFVIGTDARIYVSATRDKYLIQVFNLDGEQESTIGRDFQSRERTKEERFLAGYSGFHGGDYFEMETEDTEPDIRDLYMVDGRLLVRNSYSEHRLPEGVYTRLDMFEDGHFVGQVNILGNGTAKRDQLFFFGNGLMAIVRGNLDAIQYGIEKFLEGYQSDVVQVTVYRIHSL